MRKAAEFRRNAEECRKLARSANIEEQRLQFLKMADSWEQIASEREKLILRHPELATEGEEGAV
jgi:hypothetical protein